MTASASNNKRIAGRTGGTIELNASFYRNGVPTAPYAIRAIRIYKRSVEDANLMAEISMPDPDSTDYPFPLIQDESCGAGSYKYLFDIPCDFPAPDVFFDVWHFIPDTQCLEEQTSVDLEDESLWLDKCNKFWVYPDGWYVDDHLMVPRIGFEPLDAKFRAGEKRWLEVGMMPLPLYDYNYNQIMPMIPYLQPTITITTRNCELLVDSDEMEIGLRQGAYRSNPFVAKYMLDTTTFLKGTYDYQVTLTLPDCQTVVSPKFTLTIY